jgi:hypothetical protein
MRQSGLASEQQAAGLERRDLQFDPAYGFRHTETANGPSRRPRRNQRPGGAAAARPLRQ